MNESDILVIGGGASGIIAAREFIKAGKIVTLLEARNYLGGRVHTMGESGFTKAVEAGAEFVHGDLPITISLLQKAKIPFHPMEGKTYRVMKGENRESEEFIVNFPELLSKAKLLRQDITFAEFIDKYFNDKKYKELKETAIRFVEGYDAADIRKVSTFALREEWKSLGSFDQYRLPGGYRQIIDYLLEEIKKSDCSIHLSTVIKEVRWKQNYVEVFSSNGTAYSARKVLITVPIGILQSEPEEEGHIHFSPGLQKKIGAARKIGYGSVIKVFFEFEYPFWDKQIDNRNYIRKMPELSFLISDSPFTAWWTHLPETTPILTGWLAGPQVDKIKDRSDENILKMAIDSLCYLFDTNSSNLLRHLKAQKVINWKKDPFALGAYSYATVESEDAKKILTQPVDNTIFFAGEALSEGASMGTVEAAFRNGISMAQVLLNS